MRSEVLRIESLCKSLAGENVLNDLTLSVFQSETISLLGADKNEINAFISILSGNTPPDSGEIFIKDKCLALDTPVKAKLSGIYVIYEQSYLIDNLSIADNMFLGRETKFFQNKSKDIKEAESFLKEVGLTNISASSRVSKLTQYQKAMVELASALSARPAVLIFNKAYLFNNDERPQYLLNAFKILNRHGTAVIYLAENPEYAKALSDRILFINNGVTCGTFDRNQFDSNKFQALIDSAYPQDIFIDHPESDTPILSVRGLSGTWVKDASFSVSKGEILGVFDYDIQVQSELLQLIYGAKEYESGKIILDGKEFRPKSPSHALRAGITYVPPPTVEEHIFMNMSYKQNMTIMGLGRVSNFGFVRSYLENYYIDELSNFTNCSEHDMNASLQNISDSSVRKLLITRSAASHPKLMLLNEPFGGMDSSTKADIIKCINRMAHNGVAVIITSKHLRELKNTCSKVIYINKDSIAKK